MFHHPLHHCFPGYHGHRGRFGYHGPFGPGSCMPRRFHSRAEKLEMLKEYKAELENELAGVEEAVEKLEK